MEWIPCDKQLPPQWQEILVYSKNFKVRSTEVSLVHYYEGKKLDYPWVEDERETCDRISHWMPLPSPPKE